MKRMQSVEHFGSVTVLAGYSSKVACQSTLLSFKKTKKQRENSDDVIKTGQTSVDLSHV